MSYKSSAHFMCFYGMINFYIFTMAYVYSPITTMNGEFDNYIHLFSINNSYLIAILEPLRKDNPAFSMINDSDEDVIYGSEDDSRRPLNAANKTNDYDSD